ncbi:MAG: hypothetical protein ACPGVG_06115, partial [Mycobacterium sp.]
MTPHRILFGDLVIPSERYGFEWKFSHGVAAGGGTLSFPLPSDADIRATRIADIYSELNRPNTLTIEVDTAAEGRQSREIQNVYGHAPRITRDDTHLVMRVDVSDLRWKWVGSGVTGHFNLVRRLNDIQVLENGETPEVPGQARIVDGELVTPRLQGAATPVEPEINADGLIVNFRPKDILAKHTGYPRSSFRKATLNLNSEDFASPIGDADPSAWTALQLLEGILRGYWTFSTKGPVFVPGKLEAEEWGGYWKDKLTDNGFLVSRETFYMTPVGQVLPKLMRLAECRMVVWYDGRLYLHPTYDDEPPEIPDRPSNEPYGALYMSDNSFDRPSSVLVGFRKELTRQFVYIEEQQYDPGSGGSNVIVGNNAEGEEEDLAQLINVIQLPEEEELDLGDGLKKYQRGEWHPIEPVLKAWGFPDPPMEFIRTHRYKFFEGAVAELIYGQSAAVEPGVSEIVQRRINNILQSYRKTFRIHPDQLDILLGVKAESAVILDRISGRRALAPIWVDHALMRRLR